MAQHISIRVPWHDDGWKGSVCKEPSANMACLKLKNIMENRDDAFESSICGQCMVGREEKLPCITEGGAFMSNQEFQKDTVHPYKQNNPSTDKKAWYKKERMIDLINSTAEEIVLPYTIMNADNVLDCRVIVYVLPNTREITTNRKITYLPDYDVMFWEGQTDRKQHKRLTEI